MKNSKSKIGLMAVLCCLFLLTLCVSAQAAKPTPDEVIKILKAGNARFVNGESAHPHTDTNRLAQSGKENQGDHAYATVITCSDSRVPVERVFDAGVMDIFVIRVAGNVCDTDEVGSIEYGLAHVNTPVLVVLGHKQCGAVTAVTHAVHGTGHALERNIPPLVDNIQPAVERAMSQHSNIHGDDIIPYAIVENVYQGIEDLFLTSPATRNLVHSGKAKVVGAIYDVSTGEIEWLPERKSTQILAKVDRNPARAMNAMAGGGHDNSTASASSGGHSAPAASHAAPAASHGGDNSTTAISGHQAASTHEASAADQTAVASIIKSLKSSKKIPTHNKEVAHAGLGNKPLYGLLTVVVLLAVGLTMFYSRTKDERGQSTMKWSLGSKLIGGFGVVLVLLTVIAVYSLVSMNGIGVEIEEIAEEIIPLTNKVAEIEVAQLEQSIALERAFRFGEEEGTHAEEMFEKQVEKFEELAVEVDKDFAETIKFLEERPAHTEALAEEMGEAMNNLAKMASEHKDFDALAEKAIELIEAGKLAQARLLEEAVGEAEDELNHEIEQFMVAMEHRSEEAGKTAEADEKRAAGIMLILSIIAVILGFTIAMILTRSIVNPVNRIIANLSEGSEQVTSAAGQVSSASQSLAEGATEQAAGLEETSSSLEEMASMTKQNADNAQQANTLASDARKAADNGTDSMGRMNTAIQDIQRSSDETAKIIKVIDEIAFQTNLLALNAAVEAARAGEAGKGFAVVAEEVRNLAMRSAEAAKNTSELIEDSVKNSQSGVDIATEVGKVLEEIVGGIGKTSDLVGEIAAASQEQAQGIEQVNTAVNQMDKVTQQNAANAEESASASEELSAQAEQMNQVVNDLRALVGGATNAGLTNTTAARTTLGASDQAFHQIANQKAPKQSSAKQAIPLSDSESFNDFNS